MTVFIEVLRWIVVITWVVLGVSVLCGYPLDQFLSVIAILVTIFHYVTAGRD